jgi:hypothetical protein
MSEYARIMKRFYEFQAASLKEIFDLTTQRKITKEEFHSITSLNYDMLKKSRGW